MFDQSPHWGLRTAFPSVLRPLFICAKLGRWGCQGFPSPGPEQVNVGIGGIQGRGRWQLLGSYLCLSSTPCLNPPSVPQFPFPTSLSPSLKPPLCLSVKPASPLSCPLPFFDLPLFPQLPRLKERRGGGWRGGEQERKSSWLGRE